VIRLISPLVRKPGTTHEQFLDHWLNVHGPLIRNSTAANYVRRYEQLPTPWPAEGSGQPEPEHDGVTIQWFDTVEAFYAHMSEPDFPAMMDDIAKFLDTTKLQFMLVDEPIVVIDEL
jgi:uncharacterized protein (TIGR02118 family)